ncbi:hypothetical protein V492_03886, partial [Pseudogymnoascus sp. VKM F-4246]
ARRTPDASYSSEIECALALSWVETELEDALKQRVKQVPLEDTERWSELTCRSWVLRVLEELDAEGWISVRVGSTVEDVEAEAKDGAAAAAAGNGDRVLRMDKATAAIKAADLTPTEHLMLLDFVKEAYESSLTARVVLDRIGDGDRPVEETLRVLKEDWHELVAVISRATPIDAPLRDLVYRRDRSKCLVTPSDRQQLDAPEPTFIIPPSLTDLVGGDETKHASKSLLDAYMTPTRAARLLSMVSDMSDTGRLQNALLLTPSILQAFQNGHIDIGSPGAKSWNDIDEDSGRDDLKSELKVGALYNLQVSTSFLLGRIPHNNSPLPAFFSRTTQRIVRTIWLLVPKFIRVAYYTHTLKKWKKEYGDQFAYHSYNFPFGLNATCNFYSHFNEPVALRLVERFAPSIPAPLLIDTFRYDSLDWFISTNLPGDFVRRNIYHMSYAERDQLAADLSNVIAQMHKIPNPSPYRFASVSGGPIHDFRIDSWGIGPFNDEAI